MAPTSQAVVKPPNWLDGNRVPAEIKLIILEHTTSHQDLLSLIEAYPEWVLELWKTYPKQLWPRAWENVLNDIDEDLIDELNCVYHIRNIRKEYSISMGSSHETQQDRDQLEHDLRAILSMEDELFPEVEPSLDSILDLGKIVRDVYSLTFRYSNDAWKRIHHIAEETGTGPASSTDHTTPTAIQLTFQERFKFARAFLRVEIYLLTKYWTNAHGERHIFDMGREIRPFIPHSGNDQERGEFDSCLRYMFHAYRRHLKTTAKELGAPELPTRDDLAWVRTEEESWGDYQFEDYPTMKTDNPIFKFAQRSISEEQCFLLWLCEHGIAPLEKTHQAERTKRRDEFIRCFSEERHSWETVELRHRFFRYDLCVDEPLSRREAYTGSTYDHNPKRNRHPVMSLYGQGRRQGYSDIPSKWACASAFLTWFSNKNEPGWFVERGGITLNMHGRWITLSDTDSGWLNWKPFCLKDRIRGGVPHGHPYMMTREKYEFRSLPTRVFLMRPR